MWVLEKLFLNFQCKHEFCVQVAIPLDTNNRRNCRLGTTTYTQTNITQFDHEDIVQNLKKEKHFYVIHTSIVRVGCFHTAEFGWFMLILIF